MKYPIILARIGLVSYLVKWLLLAGAIAVMAGSASAALLLSLEWATVTRLTHHWLIWLLPLAGFAIGWLYLHFGRPVEGGNNLLIDEIHSRQQSIPLRMAPLILVGTVVSHLFGASVGREGTAVQMGGALADQLTRIFNLRDDDRRIILMAGISAGFASVFGTPLAGAIFGIEVLAIGSLGYEAIFACMVSAVVADQIGLLWGAHHVHYFVGALPAMSAWGFTAMVVSGMLFGVTGRVFALSTHRLGSWVKQRIPYAPLRPMLGGIIIAASATALNADHYLGLGISTIIEAFQHPLASYDFAAKMAFTVVSLSSGFKGGEVTPLFYIGATLGNALAPILHMPLAMMAGIGFIAVFAGAANTPVASTIMAMELFGAEIGTYAAIACVVSYLFSGHIGIYRAQRIGNAKYRHTRVPEPGNVSEGIPRIGEK